jgi:hypothetical protein
VSRPGDDPLRERPLLDQARAGSGECLLEPGGGVLVSPAMTAAAAEHVIDALHRGHGFARERVTALQLRHDPLPSGPGDGPDRLAPLRDVLRQDYLDKCAAARKGVVSMRREPSRPALAYAGPGVNVVTDPSPHLTVTGAGPQERVMTTLSGPI